MSNVITIIKNGKVMTREAGTVIKHKSEIFGDCDVCGEPFELLKNCKSGRETLICSNKSVCGHEIKLQNSIFFK